MPGNDKDLLVAWRAGHRRAGEVLFGRYRHSLYRFFRRRAGDRAEDLLQDTLLICVQQHESFQERSSFRTYVFGIAKNVLRRATQEARRLPTMLEVDDASPIAVSGPLEQECQFLARVTAHLSDREQELIRLYFWDERTGHELAEWFGVSEPTIHSRLHRVLARMRRDLGGCVPDDSEGKAGRATTRSRGAICLDDSVPQ